MLDGSEIELLVEGPWSRRQGADTIELASITLYDPSLGGTSYLSRIGDELDDVAKATIEHLDHEGCESACYRCLKSYQNQRRHRLLNWPVAMPFLEAIAAERPTPRKLEVGDIDDPRPWLEAYAAGVGSPLELKFLRLFEAHGFAPVKQHPIFEPGRRNPLTVVDFAVPGRRLAIYIDGASVHIGHVARRDRRIRERLGGMLDPWRVEVLGARDLAQGKAIVDRLLSEGPSVQQGP